MYLRSRLAVYEKIPDFDAVRAALRSEKPDLVAVAGDHVLQGPDPAGTVDRLREMEAEGAAHVEDLSLLRQRTVAHDPHLRGLATDRLAESEKAIARAVAEDAGVAADSLAAHTYAGAVITLLTTLGARFADRRLPTDPAELDQALALLRGALDALRHHSAR